MEYTRNFGFVVQFGFEVLQHGRILLYVFRSELGVATFVEPVVRVFKSFLLTFPDFFNSLLDLNQSWRRVEKRHGFTVCSFQTLYLFLVRNLDRVLLDVELSKVLVMFYLISERVIAGFRNANFDKGIGAVTAQSGHKKLFIGIEDCLFQLLIVELWVVHHGLELLHLVLIQLCVILRLLHG